VSFSWLDISSTGQRITRVSDCDDCYEPSVSLGFDFEFYGQHYASLSINSNGMLQLSEASSAWGPQSLPADDFSGPALIPFWSDWDADAGGDVYVQSGATWPGAPGEQAFVVQWQNVQSWDCDDGGSATWQVILLSDDTFVFQYLDTDLQDFHCDFGADMTVGVQRDVLQCYVEYSSEDAIVAGNTAIHWRPSVSACNNNLPTPSPTPMRTASPSPTAAASPISAATTPVEATVEPGSPPTTVAGGGALPTVAPAGQSRSTVRTPLAIETETAATSTPRSGVAGTIATPGKTKDRPRTTAIAEEDAGGGFSRTLLGASVAAALLASAAAAYFIARLDGLLRRR
jgi:hypothetical protein